MAHLRKPNSKSQNGKASYEHETLEEFAAGIDPNIPLEGIGVRDSRTGKFRFFSKEERQRLGICSGELPPPGDDPATIPLYNRPGSKLVIRFGKSKPAAA